MGYLGHYDVMGREYSLHSSRVDNAPALEGKLERAAHGRVKQRRWLENLPLLSAERYLCDEGQAGTDPP